jgi:hypothetical protein
MSIVALLVLVVVALAALAALALVLGRAWRTPGTDSAGTAPRPGGGGTTTAPPRPAPRAVTTVAELAALPKPASVSQGFGECPVDGDGGDREMNRLKNRADSAEFVPVPLELLLSLRWPEDVERRDRDNWRPADRAEVARWEGAPIAVAGYLADAKTSGPESVNCHGADNAYRDWHVWIVGQPGADRTRSLVVEPTPLTRARHPGWTLARVRAVQRAGLQVRVSGWLFLDPEHPEQIGRTRGTIWEIHPLVTWDVRTADGRWVPLDAYTTPARPTTPRRPRGAAAGR